VGGLGDDGEVGFDVGEEAGDVDVEDFVEEGIETRWV